MNRAALASLLLALPLALGHAAAQDAAPPVLKVYANLIQIPVLVLDRQLNPLPQRLPADRFSVRLDGGPWWPHARVHQEGDDPIDLAIVVDNQPPVTDLISKISESIAQLAPGGLHPHDSVSLYVMDCTGVHTTRNVPAGPGKLATAVANTFRGTIAHNDPSKIADCNAAGSEGGAANPQLRSRRAEQHLWDVLAYATGALAPEPGRRVVLVISSGFDQHSTRTPDQVLLQAVAQGVSLFSINPMPVAARVVGLGVTSVAALPVVCEGSGGMMLQLGTRSVSDAMQQLIKTLRERYIVEFPRPANAGAGAHHIEVKIDKGVYFIRAAGDGVPVPDAQLAQAPNVLHPQGTDAPQLGNEGKRERELALAQQVAKSLTLEPPPTPSSPPASAAPAQPAPTPRPTTKTAVAVPEPPRLKVTTKLTIEDVTAVDKAGHPVHGLQQTNFTVSEDGKPQPIRAFAEYGTEIAAATSIVTPRLAPGVYTNQQQEGLTTSASNILLLDLVNTLPPGMSATEGGRIFETERRQSIDYIRKMPEGTMLAILLLDGELHLVQGFTSDREVLLSALNALKPGADRGTLTSDSAEICSLLNVRALITLHTLEQVAAFADGKHGRKNLLWFTNGMPQLTVAGRDQINTGPVMERRNLCVADYSTPMHRIYGMLNNARVAIYTMDPRGVYGDLTNPFTNASVGANSSIAGTAVTGSIGAGPVAKYVEFMDKASMQSASLREISNATGGTAYYNRNDLDAVLADAVNAGSDYYSIAYTPPATGYDGKHHAISIKVDRPGVQLHYREGYTPVNPMSAAMPTLPGDIHNEADKKTKKNPYDKIPDPSQDFVQFRNSMTHGAVVATELSFTVEPKLKQGATKQLKGKPAQTWNFNFTLQPDQFQFADNKVSLRFDVAAYGEDGTLLNALSQTIAVNVTREQMEQFLNNLFEFNEPLDLPADKLFIRGGVLDTTSGKMGTLEIPLQR